MTVLGWPYFIPIHENDSHNISNVLRSIIYYYDKRYTLFYRLSLRWSNYMCDTFPDFDKNNECLTYIYIYLI